MAGLVAAAGRLESEDSGQESLRPAGDISHRADRWHWCRQALWLALLLLLGAWSWKTVARNQDWLDEERLFIAAQKVLQCPDIRV